MLSNISPTRHHAATLSGLSFVCLHFFICVLFLVLESVVLCFILHERSGVKRRGHTRAVLPSLDLKDLVYIEPLLGYIEALFITRAFLRNSRKSPNSRSPRILQTYPGIAGLSSEQLAALDATDLLSQNFKRSTKQTCFSSVGVVFSQALRVLYIWYRKYKKFKNLIPLTQTKRQTSACVSVDVSNLRQARVKIIF